MSLPSASGVMPQARATAWPPLEPPQVLVGSYGLPVAPKTGLKDCEPAPNSRHVGFAHGDGAGRVQPLDDQLALRRHVVAVDGRAVGGADAGGVGRILVQHRQAVQGADLFAPGQRVVRGLGAFQRLFGQEGDDGVDGRVDAFDPGDVGLGQFDAGKVAAADAGGQFGGVEKAEISRHLRARLQGGIHL